MRGGRKGFDLFITLIDEIAHVVRGKGNKNPPQI
jgi:hypothetical protein